MDIAGWAIDRKTFTLVITAVLLIGGALAYTQLARLEDPEFTIKDAIIVTLYPGASPEEVEREVTDEIEVAVQQLGQLDEVESRSERGMSTVTVHIKDHYGRDELPQVWDELRRKVNDAQTNLPPGAGPSLVVDDYGDVFGVFYALYGDEYTEAELYDVAKEIRRELLLVQDVAKITFHGVQTEVILIEPDRDRMSQLGVSIDLLAGQFQAKSVALDGGRVRVGDEYITIEATGDFASLEDIEEMLIRGGAGSEQILLRDVATVRRGYLEPTSARMRHAGQPAVGIGISTVTGGNVVTMGTALEKRLAEIQPMIPLGMELGVVSMQSDAVTRAIDGFVVGLGQAIAIVVVVLLFFMGVRSGLLIGLVLLVTIAGSFIIMQTQGIILQRVSLGALVIALGMLVDNAIVVVDGMLVRAQRGRTWRESASEVVRQTATPLLGATLIAILAFAAIGTSDDSTGEFCRSLFQVILISLLLSWVTAVTVTPLLGTMMLRVGRNAQAKDPYDSRFYRLFRAVLSTCLRRRHMTMAAITVLFIAAIVSFGAVEQNFFPDSNRPQFMVDVWVPQGTHIDVTTAHAEEIESTILGVEGVDAVTSLIGRGGPRFLLTYAPELPNPAYVQFIVDVESGANPDVIRRRVQHVLDDELVYGEAITQPFVLGPGGGGRIRARFFGPDRGVLRDLERQTLEIFRAHPKVYGVRTDWRSPVKVVRPVLAEEQANLAGITPQDVARVLRQGFQGIAVGQFRDDDELHPILLRARAQERDDVSSIQNLQILSPVAGHSIPLRQVVKGFETTFEDEIIVRLNRERALTVLADPIEGTAADLLAELRPLVEAIDVPEGYRLEWWGETKDSREAQSALLGNLPVFLLCMVLIVIGLFNSLRTTLVVWLIVPLSVIGVASGLLLTSQPFGFMALLGFLSLSGMLIKNAVVLIDEIRALLAEGRPPYDAVLDAATSRLRPVAMAAATTILGMVPLFTDVFFVSMAVTIAFGLGFATLLTMIVVPVLYAMVYRIPRVSG